jgi:hypothetical protein
LVNFLEFNNRRESEAYFRIAMTNNLDEAFWILSFNQPEALKSIHHREFFEMAFIRVEVKTSMEVD